MVSTLVKVEAVKLAQPKKGLLVEPVPQLTVTLGVNGPGANVDTKSGFGPILRRIISFLPSLLPSQASTNMPIISKHFEGILPGPPPLVHGCDKAIFMKQLKIRNNNVLVLLLIHSNHSLRIKRNNSKKEGVFAIYYKT
jgi:hypothetical protein